MRAIPIIQPVQPIGQIRRIRLISLIGLVLFPFCTLAQPANPAPEPVAVKPFLDVPMRSPSICRTPEGEYLLTGTVAVAEDDPSDPTDQTDHLDFQNNDGIRLWKSADLENWEEVGRVWSIDKHAARDSWQRLERPQRTPPDTRKLKPEKSPPVRGMTSPKIHCIKGTCVISYSMNGWGCGLLRSTSGKPEGPYEDIGQVTADGASLSLFEDDDGSVYMAMDEGWIAKMKDDLSGPAEQPRLIMPESGSDLGNAPFTVGRAGAFLFKRNGIYGLAVAEWTGRTGRPVYDTYVATAKSIYGPYDCRHLMVAHGGESTVFEGPKGLWFATMAGDDVNAKFRNRSAIAPLEWTKGELYFTRGVQTEFPAKPGRVITERGPWEKCRPLTDDVMRDIEIMPHTDGYIYYNGSCLSDRYNDKVVLWRFKDDEVVKVGRGEATVQPRVLMHFKDLHWLDYENRMKYGKGKWGYGLTRCMMDANVFFIKDTFYVTFQLYGGGDLSKHGTLDGGKTFTHGCAVIRSNSGTWDGPWESVARGPYFATRLHEDKEGRIVTQRGPRGVLELMPDGSWQTVKTNEELVEIEYPGQGMSYVDDGGAMGSVWFDHYVGNYRWVGGEWNGVASLHIEGRPGSTYDLGWSYSESGEERGPYPRYRFILPHCGSAHVFRDSKGRYWSTFFGNDSTAPWWCKMGIVPLKVEKQGKQYIYNIADEWPEE